MNTTTGTQSPKGNPTPMIDVRDLTKHYGAFPALQNVSFQIGKGEATAMWGPNGAGKTTILRCLLGLTKFDGQIRVDGRDPVSDGTSVRSVLGYVPQELPIHPMTIGEMVSFIAKLKRADEEESIQRLEVLRINEQVNKEVAELSGGMRQRLALALALIGNPSILFLDEPTANLDQQGRSELLQILHEFKSNGITVLFSSHRPEDVVALADQVLHLNGGILERQERASVFANHADNQLRLIVQLRNGHRRLAEDSLTTMGLTAQGEGKILSIPMRQNQKAAVVTKLTRDGIDIEQFDWEHIPWTPS